MVNCSKRLGGVPSELLAAHQPRKAREIVPPEGQEHQQRTLLLQTATRSRTRTLRDKGISAGIGMGTISDTIIAIPWHCWWQPRLKNCLMARLSRLNYVQQGLAVFDDIRDLLQRQFDRLSEIEQEMIVWLAITGNRTHCLS